MAKQKNSINVNENLDTLAREKAIKRNFMEKLINAKLIEKPKPVEKPDYAPDNTPNYPEFKDMVDGLNKEFGTKAEDVKLTDNLYRAG